MNKALISAAIAGIITIGTTFSANAADANAGKEKCYGIAKAGKNSCKSANGSHSCAGQSTKDNDANDWTLVNKGSCKAAGGKLTAGAGNMMKKKEGTN